MCSSAIRAACSAAAACPPTSTCAARRCRGTASASRSPRAPTPAQPLRIYEMQSDGSNCAQIAGARRRCATCRTASCCTTSIRRTRPTGGSCSRPRAAISTAAPACSGPTRTPAALQPNANIYVFDASASPPVRQLTYLLDQELQPSVMRDGRVIFSAEKRARDFHQIAGRRQNLDGGDYHPLFAQRPSIGFESATEIVELANRDFAIVAAPLDARDGGGAIAIVNRSIGPDQDDRDAADRAYIHSLTMPVPGAFGGSTGVFRSPAPLPGGYLIAACDLGAGRPAQQGAALRPMRARSELGRSAAHAVPRRRARRGRAGRGLRARPARRVHLAQRRGQRQHRDRRRREGRDRALPRCPAARHVDVLRTRAPAGRSTSASPASQLCARARRRTTRPASAASITW